MPKLKCGVLTGYLNPGIDTLLAIDDYEFAEIPSHLVGFDIPKNYRLPNGEHFDLIFVEDSLFQVFEKKYPGQYNTLIARLRKLTKKNLVVAVAGRDWFQMSNPPHAYEEFDFILKTSGVFKDKELYNYENGACSTNRDWLSKTTPRKEKYSNSILDKLKPSYPCFISINRTVRNKVRRYLPHLSGKYRLGAYLYDLIFDLKTTLLLDYLDKEPEKFLHCVGGVTHYQRIELMQKLRRLNFSGDQWLNRFNGDFLWEFGRRLLTKDEKKSIHEICKRDNLYGKRISRNKFKSEMMNHQIILAPTGYGELTFRHAEAWRMKRTLICQDLSHVDMLYPLKDLENVVYCKSDFSDLEDKLNSIESNEINYKSIAKKGYEIWKNWDQPEKVFNISVKNYINEVIGK